MSKFKIIHSCYQCEHFKRVKDIPILRDLKIDLEGACYGHKDMNIIGAPIAMPIYRIDKHFPGFCGLEDFEGKE